MPTTYLLWGPLTAYGWDHMPRLVEELPPTWDQSWTRVPKSWASQGRGGVWGAGNNMARNLWVTLAQSW